MTLIAGIDISTRRLDAAILPIDPDLPQTLTLRTYELPRSNDAGARLLTTHIGIRYILRSQGLTGDITSCWIEEPRGRFAVRPLNQVFGACMGGVPDDIARSGIAPQEWRSALGLPRSLPKPDAIEAALEWILAANVAVHDQTDEPMSEHVADAILIALAGRTITWRHHDAA